MVYNLRLVGLVTFVTGAVFTLLALAQAG